MTGTKKDKNGVPTAACFCKPLKSDAHAARRSLEQNHAVKAKDSQSPRNIFDPCLSISDENILTGLYNIQAGIA